jgi:membrane fusion protein (multidrug efflux system)
MKKRNVRRWIVLVVGVLLLVGALAGVKAGQIVTMVRAGEAFAPPPDSVTSAKVDATEWESTRGAIGSLVAVRGVTLGSEVAGTVREIGFESGALVKRGAVLVKLDTSAEEAQLASASADAALAAITLKRARMLRAAESNAEAELDTAEARAKQTIGVVENLKAVIAKKTIRAPFDGRIAIRQVELGQVVSVGTPVASLQSVTPIHADFWLPQAALAELQAGQRARLQTDAFRGASWDGEVTTVNPEVDPSTRNVRIRATFPNADGRLRPGMFANVEVLSPEKRAVLVIPATAVIFAPYGDSVFVLEEKKDGNGPAQTIAHQRFIRAGDRRGDFVAVSSGLKAGERVASSGAFKLRNGSPVVVSDKLAPGADLAPKPTDQ